MNNVYEQQRERRKVVIRNSLEFENLDHSFHPWLPYTWLHSVYSFPTCVQSNMPNKKGIIIMKLKVARKEGIEKMLTLIWKFDREQASDLYNRFFLSGLPNNLHQFRRLRFFLFSQLLYLFLSLSFSFPFYLLSHRRFTGIPHISKRQLSDIENTIVLIEGFMKESTSEWA